MWREKWNSRVGLAMVVMSLAAMLLVLVAVTTGWERGLKDEGTAAHLFQLLIAGQLPLLGLFLFTLDRASFQRALRIGAAETAALAFAFGGVAWFHL